MNICINKWYGRLGNNIIQVKHALLLALYYDFNVILPNHPYFNSEYIIINPKITKYNSKIQDTQSEFFCLIDKNLTSYYQPVFDVNLDTVYKIIKKIFTIKDVDVRPVNDLVIHIRGGDIFSNNPHPGYISPPLSYYTNILNNNHFDKIIIISEDTLNPCVNALLGLYPNITYKKNTLSDDIRLLLQSSNVIFSVGTFVSSLLLLSCNIKNIYATNEINNTLDTCSHINIHKTDLSKYFKLMGPWKNTKEQRHILLNYKL